ncbi:unnamed protein product [Caenorhabditis bovis]|uniref:Helicase ATP-binding domain-containing protein n=1 Tax=Caenorhabditis bovis TaxID=2654633 RepID=A0A8S1ET64_9PELO|nr:unnamed protein product [Caenorhabditis bovis]
MHPFSFPFQPYEIQLKLMNEIRNCIENRQVGIFESPTGTGKSLSVLCATMTWLEEENERIERELKMKMEETKENIAKAENDDNADWIAAHKKKMEARREQDEIYEKIESRKRIRERIENAKKNLVEQNSRKRKNFQETDEFRVEDLMEKDELAPPEEYDSDGGIENSLEEEEKPQKCTKIFYASRTHSQLEQLLEELAKTRFRPRVVSCASRSTLCVNEQVTKLKLNHLINEKCMELRKNKLKEPIGEKKSKNDEGKCKTRKNCTNSCEYYNSTGIEEIVNGILANNLNNTFKVIKHGKNYTGCPYFATRKSIPLCELVLLPYQVILHGPTRQAWGIELDGNVVVLDEAHNVLNTIGSLYSAEISTRSLHVAVKLIREYIDAYKLRLKAKNLLYMRHLSLLANSMLKFLTSTTSDDVLTISGLLIKLNTVEINLFKLAAYIERTDLCKKFHGFYMRMRNEEARQRNSKPKLSGIAKLMAKDEAVEECAPIQEVAQQKAVPSPLFAFKSFIDAMTNRCEDGRIVVEKAANEAKLRYILLNPADRLAEVVKGARATVLVGGTMEPAQLLIETLSRANLDNDIRRFSCSHVIDDDQLLAISVERTFDGKPFQLTFQTRGNDTVLKSLGESLLALVEHLPNGVVIFVPSYDFLFNLHKKLSQFGIMKRIEERKSVFFESRSASCGDVWEKFSRAAARASKGAAFFAVVGGKMSEGINFCDELGRAVIVVGLPYPNRNSVELKERMRFLDSQMPNGGNLLYESLCMHAVNQAIGRAIRHRRDYAAVYLFDERFAKESTRSKLSSWIGEKTRHGMQFSEIIQATNAFFAEKNTRD